MATLIGNLLSARKERKAIQKQNERISQTMMQIADLRKEERQDIENLQLQTFNRNLNVQASSGFTDASFNRLNTYSRSEDARRLDLFDKETGLILAEREASKGIVPSRTISTIKAVSQTLQQFAGLSTGVGLK